MDFRVRIFPHSPSAEPGRSPGPFQTPRFTDPETPWRGPGLTREQTTHGEPACSEWRKRRRLGPLPACKSSLQKRHGRRWASAHLQPGTDTHRTGPEGGPATFEGLALLLMSARAWKRTEAWVVAPEGTEGTGRPGASLPLSPGSSRVGQIPGACVSMQRVGRLKASIVSVGARNGSSWLVSWRNAGLGEKSRAELKNRKL